MKQREYEMYKIEWKIPIGLVLGLTALASAAFYSMKEEISKKNNPEEAAPLQLDTTTNSSLFNNNARHLLSIESVRYQESTIDKSGCTSTKVNGIFYTLCP